ncbi:family 16 glycosylhydrolase [Leifsonia sp. LS1]|uniref:family 16 glycosylhydrolase n=1 Tax=Leifsonia sp. LS1 TaxID=2828483 RepID=UPI001CFDDC47|nr:family 16 glycosylhydrolase [Leifsonia sp. LS1]
MLRLLDLRRQSNVFSSGAEQDALRRIYVINLDRKIDRWRLLRRELGRFRDRHGVPLTAIARRFSAVDARHSLASQANPSDVIAEFTLAEQLTVHPNPLLQIDAAATTRVIKMSREEVAVALSHIAVWHLIAGGDVPSALVLEDDVFMGWGFARRLREVWQSLERERSASSLDLLYLAFNDVRPERDASRGAPAVRRQAPGLWEAAGYVLTRQGAKKLLDRIPVRGPVDLWLNFQLAELGAYTSASPLIEQRADEPSTNSYSVLPVLSQVGAITREKPLATARGKLPGPIFAFGPPDTGLSSLATALSMLGYTTISDVDTLPATGIPEIKSPKGQAFSAYVNVAVLTEERLARIASRFPSSLFIRTGGSHQLGDIQADRLLALEPSIEDKWAALARFLNIDYPSFSYPEQRDLGQRRTDNNRVRSLAAVAPALRWDKSPWVIRGRLAESGVRLHDGAVERVQGIPIEWRAARTLDEKTWTLRDDTFPSNLALFDPANVVTKPDAPAKFVLRERPTRVRDFSAAAIASNEEFLYGTFAAKLRPARTPGVITGLFLHRNGPRQEIDIEFRGKDTTRMLVNVFYNPGPPGTKLEYGYRGTPSEIVLGFDASDDFHMYEIEWRPEYIRWRVDGRLVHERVMWNPTPIPDNPLEFNINLWPSRSKEFAGELRRASLPAVTEVRSILIVPADSSSSGNSTEVSEVDR